MQLCHHARYHCKTRQFCLLYLRNARRHHFLYCPVGTHLCTLTNDKLWDLAVHNYRLHLNLYSDKYRCTLNGPLRHLFMPRHSRIFLLVPGTDILLTLHSKSLLDNQPVYTLVAWNTRRRRLLKQWKNFNCWYQWNFHTARHFTAGKVRFTFLKPAG